MSARHTEGPWKRRKKWRSDTNALEIYPNDKSIRPPFVPSAIAQVEERDSVKETLANARLIAAAPAMLAALEAWDDVEKEDAAQFAILIQEGSTVEQTLAQEKKRDEARERFLALKNAALSAARGDGKGGS